jgi:hypothetical protein
VLELAGALFGVALIDFEHLGEEDLGKAMTTNDTAGALLTVAGELDARAGRSYVFRGDEVIDCLDGIAVQFQRFDRLDRPLFLLCVPEALEHFISGWMLHGDFSW